MAWSLYRWSFNLFYILFVNHCPTFVEWPWVQIVNILFSSLLLLILHGKLNAKAQSPYRLDLNNYLVSSWWKYLGKIEICGLCGGGLSLLSCFEISKDSCLFKLALFFLFVGQEMWALSCCSKTMPAAVLPIMMIINSFSSRTVSSK